MSWPKIAQQTGVIPATVTDPTKAAALAATIGSRFGQVVLAPLGTGADDDARERAVYAACGPLGYTVIKAPGTWYHGAVAYTVAQEARPSVKPSLSLARWCAEMPADPTTDPTVTLPSWMTFACATAARTTQISATSIKVVPATANAPLWISLDGVLGALSVPPAATNETRNGGPWNSALTGWAAGTVGCDNGAVLGPDGSGTNAREFQFTAFGNTSAVSITPSSGVANCVASFWGVRPAAGGGSLDQFVSDTGPLTLTAPTTTSWARYDLIAAAALADAYMVQGNASTSTIRMYGLQVEPGKAPTELILSGNAATARAASSITITGCLNKCPGGAFRLTLGLLLMFAQNEGSNDQTWALNADTSIKWNNAAATFSLVVGGSAVATSAALTFTRGTFVSVSALLAPDGYAEITVRGAATGNGTVTGQAAGWIVPLDSNTWTAAVGNPIGYSMVSFDYPVKPGARTFTVLCVGDSITSYGYYQQEWAARALRYRNVQPIFVGPNTAANGIRNAGTPGWTITNMNAKLAEYIETYRPDFVLIMGGTNDAAGDTPAATIRTSRATYRTICKACGIPADHIIEATPPPYNATADDPATRAAREAIRVADRTNTIADSATAGTILLDLFGAMTATQMTTMLGVDGVHPAWAGYYYAADRAAQIL